MAKQNHKSPLIVGPKKSGAPSPVRTQLKGKNATGERYLPKRKHVNRLAIKSTPARLLKNVLLFVRDNSTANNRMTSLRKQPNIAVKIVI